MQIKHYVPGKKPITLTQLPEHIALDNDDLLWVNLVDPTPEYLTELVPFFENDGEEQDRLLESMLLKHHRPTIQQYETCSLIIAIVFTVEQGSVQFGEVQLLFGKNFLVSIWRNTSLAQQDIQRYVEKQSTVLERGADYVAAEILDFVTDEYSEQLLLIEKQVERTESHFFEGRPSQEDIKQIHRLRRMLLRVYHSINSLPDMARRFNRQHHSYVDKEGHGYFYEVADRVARQAEFINMLRETLAFSFEAGMMLMQLQQDDTTRKLAAWAAIIAIPTAVAGIYGMNFENMPELNFRFAYPVVLGVMASICTALYLKFKRIKWL